MRMHVVKVLDDKHRKELEDALEMRIDSGYVQIPHKMYLKHLVSFDAMVYRAQRRAQ